MSDLQTKINTRMDQLQKWMESNHHLEHPDQVEMLIYSISKFWSVLSDEDKDYIHCSKYAIEEKSKWEV